MIADTFAMARNFFAKARATGGGARAGNNNSVGVVGFLKANWLLVLHHVGVVLVFIPVANWTPLGHYVTGKSASTVAQLQLQLSCSTARRSYRYSVHGYHIMVHSAEASLRSKQQLTN